MLATCVALSSPHPGGLHTRHATGESHSLPSRTLGVSTTSKAGDSEKPICFLVPARPQRSPLTKIRSKDLQHIKNNLDSIHFSARNKHQTSPVLLLAPRASDTELGLLEGSFADYLESRPSSLDGEEFASCRRHPRARARCACRGGRAACAVHRPGPPRRAVFRGLCVV